MQSCIKLHMKHHPPMLKILFTHLIFTNSDTINHLGHGDGCFVQLHGQRGVSFIYLMVIMCFSNLVQTLLIQLTKEQSKSNITCMLTTGTPLYYSRCELVELRQPNKHVHLLGLTTRTIANNGKLRLNK